MTTIDKQAPVLVTGASGYIAGWIIRYLLEEGRTVHATVRDPGKKASVAHLEAIAAKTKGQLKFFKADLLDVGSFDEAAKGCELVLHTASPFVISGFTDANEALVRPAVEGTRNVLETVNRTPSVKRVVLTTSIAAIFGDNQDLRNIPGGVFTEEHWNTSSSVDHQPYSYSKVAAEREAWKIANAQKRWDLVCINPAFVLGPSLTKSSVSTSIETLVNLGSGKLRTGVPHLMFSVVDVRDVARAHLLAGDTPSANGRHIVAAQEMSLLDMAKTLRPKFPKYPLPTFEIPKATAWLMGPITADITRKFVSTNVGWPLKLDNSRSRKALGLKYLPVQKTLNEHFQQLIDDGLLKAR
ncbi:MAG TPA: aldehyde reductase [Nevskiaceae bacterium]|nr:aldehyde reductase [Nevskiaceae bacterium]